MRIVPGNRSHQQLHVAMASSSTFSWKWPPTTEASRPSLTISTFPPSSFFFHDSNRPFAAARRLRRLSSRDSPPSVENKNADLVIQSREGGEKGWSQGARFSGEMAEANHVVEGTESIAPQRRMVKDIFLRDLFRRRPLWKRIVFASKKVRSIMLLNVITVIYASDIPVLKEVEQIVDPAVFTVVRFSITALPFLPFMLKPDVNSNVRSTGIELGLWISLGYLCQALGLLTSEAGRASFISAFTIILVPLIDGMFGATIPTITWSGALLSFVGVAMMEYGGSPNVGDVLNFLSALFFGIHILRTEQIVRSTKKTKLSALLGYEVVVVALSSAIWFILQKFFLDKSGSNLRLCTWSVLWEWIISFPWIPALYTGVFSTGLCLVAEMDAMRDVSATETAIIYGLEPVWGAAFAWFLLGERWDFSEWIGAALVLCGSLLVQVLGGTQTTKNDAHFF